MKKIVITTYGKWILSGEHTVVRGGEALVFPLKGKVTRLTYTESEQNLTLTVAEGFGRELELLFWGVLEKALEWTGLEKPRGEILLESTIPVGAGLGASAALCVAFTRWFKFLGADLKESEYEFARRLENLFHGESSGVDIAVVQSEEALVFSRNGLRQKIKPLWRPHLYLTFTGDRGVTRECVRQVQLLISKNESLGEKIDQQMKESVDLAYTSLCKKEDFQSLKKSFDLASDCFSQWGLWTPRMRELESTLKKAGAVAVKPTGSGNGGFLLSLWQEEPTSVGLELISAT